MLKIWGNADSVNVQKVLWCCEEAGIAYERIDAGRHYGVVVLAEGLIELLDPQELAGLQDVERDEHGHIRFA